MVQILLEPLDPEWVAGFFEQQALVTDTSSREHPTSGLLRKPLLRTGRGASKLPITPIRAQRTPTNSITSSMSRPAPCQSRSEYRRSMRMRNTSQTLTGRLIEVIRCTPVRYQAYLSDKPLLLSSDLTDQGVWERKEILCRGQGRPDTSLNLSLENPRFLCRP